MKRLILIESSDIGARYSGLSAKRLGFEPLFLADLSNYQADTLKQLREFDVLNTRTDQVEPLLEILKNRDDVAGVVTFLDSRLEIAIDLAQMLNVPGLEPTLRPLKDKAHVYDLAPITMPATLRVNSYATTTHGLWLKFLSQHGRAILKPCKTAGAIGARIFDSTATANDLIQHMDATEIPEYLDPRAWILQAFTPGDLMSLEGYVSGGAFYPLGITGRRKIGQTESAATFPDDHRLSPQHYRELVSNCAALIRSAQVNFSYFHIEFIVGPKGPLIIDANIGRLGGGGLGELLALSYGLDPVDIFSHAMAVSLKIPSENPYLVRNRHATSIFYGIPELAILDRVESKGFEGGYHTQILDAGTAVPPMGVNNWSWIAIASGLSATLPQHMKHVRIHTRQGVYPPCY